MIREDYKNYMFNDADFLPDDYKCADEEKAKLIKKLVVMITSDMKMALTKKVPENNPEFWLIDRLLEMVSTTNDHALYRQMDMVNDTLISGGIKYYDELKSDLEDVEYTKNNEDTPYLEFLLSIIYKNMGNESKSKEYKNKALEDSKGTVYESLIQSQN